MTQEIELEQPLTAANVCTKYAENSLNYALTRLFRRTSLVLVGASLKSGVWKTGKTDFSLYIAKRCLALGLVSEVASNINTYGTFPLIEDTETLNAWLSSDAQKKLFVFDEGNEHLANTAFMTSKSTGFKAVLPQISKKKGRLIVIGQDIDTLDKTFRSNAWKRGVFLKTSLKTATLSAYWNPLKPMEFIEIPATSVKFDPYLAAEWGEQSTHIVQFKKDSLQILWKWSKEGKSIKELGIHAQQLNRLCRSFVARMLETDKALMFDKEPEPKEEVKQTG